MDLNKNLVCSTGPRSESRPLGGWGSNGLEQKTFPTFIPSYARSNHLLQPRPSFFFNISPTYNFSKGNATLRTCFVPPKHLDITVACFIKPRQFSFTVVYPTTKSLQDQVQPGLTCFLVAMVKKKKKKSPPTPITLVYVIASIASQRQMITVLMLQLFKAGH